MNNKNNYYHYHYHNNNTPKTNYSKITTHPHNIKTTTTLQPQTFINKQYKTNYYILNLEMININNLDNYLLKLYQI